MSDIPPDEDSDPQLKYFRRNIYLYSFCEGLVFWYAIEKLFQQGIGFSMATIVTVGLIVQAGKMVFEIPSSVLADRWNRRNTLIAATIIMMVSSALLPFTRAPVTYTLAMLFWTIYIAFKSGTSEAFIFDSLKELKAEKSFQQVLARFESLELMGLIVSGLMAGIVVNWTNLQVPFWLTLLPMTMGVVALLKLSEPAVERNFDGSRWWHHARDAWGEIRANAILWVILLYAMLFGLQTIWYEYYQLYGLAVHTPEIWFGALIAVLCLGLIVGSELTRKFKPTKKMLALVWVVLTLAHIIGLITATFVGFMVVLFMTMICMQIMYLSFIAVINHSVGSTRRATIISLGGSASQILFLGLAVVFRLVVDHWGVQAAFLMAALPLILLGAIDIMRKIPWFTDEVMSDADRSVHNEPIAMK